MYALLRQPGCDRFPKNERFDAQTTPGQQPLDYDGSAPICALSSVRKYLYGFYG